ncbi:MAG TPA: NUDIX hydrolase [Thermoanaerobaculia bacterium]|nr:NUDIX hydrolase [Thermoanaerobaculia bacterium]
MNSEVLFEGRHLAFRRRRGWEYVEHRAAKESVMVVALAEHGQIVLVEEFRPAVDASVICLPAGLVGDEGPEDRETAARRELREETGWEASTLEFLGRGPGSAGMSSEIVSFYLARGVRRGGEQGDREREEIRVHVVSVSQLTHWTREREAEGKLIDPKVWAGVHLAEASRARP